MERGIHVEKRLFALRDQVWSRLIWIDEFVEVEDDAAKLNQSLVLIGGDCFAGQKALHGFGFAGGRWASEGEV